jgi:hypothetical protein
LGVVSNHITSLKKMQYPFHKMTCVKRILRVPHDPIERGDKKAVQGLSSSQATGPQLSESFLPRSLVSPAEGHVSSQDAPHFAVGLAQQQRTRLVHRFSHALIDTLRRTHNHVLPQGHQPRRPLRVRAEPSS